MSSWRPGPRPEWLQALHEIADPAWIRLDADEILAEARQRTGLSDFGDPSFEEPYRIFVRSVDEESHSHAVGRMIARDDLRNWLENRIKGGIIAMAMTSATAKIAKYSIALHVSQV